MSKIEDSAGTAVTNLKKINLETLLLLKLLHNQKQYNLKENRFRVLDTLPNRDAIKHLLHESDIYLDAVPYSGATSLLDPLEVGVPPVVWEGQQLRFCQGALILKELGMRDLIVHNRDEYIDLAIRLAHDSNFRFEKCKQIIEKMNSLPEFQNPANYSRQISKIFKQMLQAAKSD